MPQKSGFGVVAGVPLLQLLFTVAAISVAVFVVIKIFSKNKVSSSPGSSIPGSSIPGSSTPGSSIPGSSTPGSSTPGSSIPGSSTPGSSGGACKNDTTTKDKFGLLKIPCEGSFTEDEIKAYANYLNGLGAKLTFVNATQEEINLDSTIKNNTTMYLFNKDETVLLTSDNNMTILNSALPYTLSFNGSSYYLIITPTPLGNISSISTIDKQNMISGFTKQLNYYKKCLINIYSYLENKTTLTPFMKDIVTVNTYNYIFTNINLNYLKTH